MRKNLIQAGLFILVVPLIITSCYPNEYDNLADLDVVQTQYDQEFDFGSREYYLLADTVPLITGEDTITKTREEIMLDEAILEEIASQMNSAGYTRLSPADTTDENKMSNAVVVLATRSEESYAGYYYDYYYYGYDYWNSYYGMNYYYPGYNWNYYYPWGYPTVYSYSIGTVIIEMVDPIVPYEIDRENDEVLYPVRWMAVLNGIAEQSIENTEQRTIDGIRQAFSQSPYLF